MSKAERADSANEPARHHVSSASRRAMLAGIAVLPLAGAVPALAAGGSSFPDLAAQWAPVFARWRDTVNREHARRQRYDERVFAVTGITFDEIGDLDYDDPRRRAYFDARGALGPDPDDDRGPVDEHGCSIEWNEIHGEVDPLVVEILSRPARSLADLALQAQVFAVYAQEKWTERHNDNVDDRMRVLVDNLCALAGVEALPGVLDVLPPPELEA